MRKATIHDTFKDDLYEAIDENGPYSQTAIGNMDPQSIVTLHRVIQDYAYKAFKVSKEVAMEKRLKLLKAGKDNQYQESILQSQLEFQKILARTT